MIDIRLDETMMENISRENLKKMGAIWHKSKTGVKQVGGASLKELKGAFRFRKRKSACEKQNSWEECILEGESVGLCRAVKKNKESEKGT